MRAHKSCYAFTWFSFLGEPCNNYVGKGGMFLYLVGDHVRRMFIVKRRISYEHEDIHIQFTMA